MLKQLTTGGLLSVSIVLILGTSAKALNINGVGMRLGSLFCEMDLELERGDPEKMLARCLVMPTEVEADCEELEHDGRSEKRDRFPTLVGKKKIDKDEFEDGMLTVEFPVDTHPLSEHEACEDSYKKSADFIIEEAIVRFEVFECIGGHHTYKSCSRIAKKPLDSVIAECELSEDEYNYDCDILKSRKPKHKNRY
jgi:hypothetical protein